MVTATFYSLVDAAMSVSVVMGTRKTSSLVSDVGRYVIIGQLLDVIFNILLLFICRWEIQTHFT